MRVVLALFTLVLVIIALLGIGFGIYISYQGTRAGQASDTIVALAMASVPFAVGTVALSAVAIVFAIDVSQ